MTIEVKKNDNPQISNFDYSPEFNKIAVCGADP